MCMELIEEYPYFFTATILEWKHLLKPDKFKDIIIISLIYMVVNNRMKIFGFVIMSNHIHIIWLNLAPFNQAQNQLSFMKFTAQMILKELRNSHNEVLKHFEVNLKDRKYQIWKRNPLSIELRSSEISAQKLKYIHENPLRAGLFETNVDYKYSSAKYYESNKSEWVFLSNIFE
jgi:putative transposase